MTISASQVYLLNNKMGKVASSVQLGTLLQNAEAVTAGEIALAEGTVLVGNASGVAAATTLTSGQILVGSASSKAAAVSITGDITVSSTGVSAIGAGKVLLAMLATGVAPSHVVKFAGKFTTAGGDANEQVSVAGVTATDVVVYSLQDKGGTPRTILTGKPGTNVIDFVLSGDPSTDHVISYVVYRAAS